MKYSRDQFKEYTYQLWKNGITLPECQNPNSYVVKYRIGEVQEYSSLEIKAQSMDEALELACFHVAQNISVSPEDVDLHSIYDIEGKLLWGDGLPGMNRREFLTVFGLANAALLFGFPKAAKGATTSVSLAGSASGFTSVDDVFSTNIYTGNSGTQTINNGIDLAGNGGMVWLKRRDTTLQAFIHDTATTGGPEAGYYLCPSSTAAESYGASYLTSYASNGFSVGNSPYVNQGSMVSWTFRKATKFFDIVTYTGNGVANRQISHNLGIAPGMIVIKSTSLSQAWVVYHRSLTFPQSVQLNATSEAVTFSPNWLGTSQPTDQNFYLGTDGAANTSGATYIAYLFAHDTSPDGVIQCGEFTESARTDITLGWEPQFVMVKVHTHAGYGWYIYDSKRGLLAPDGTSTAQIANSTNADTTGFLNITSTGFQQRTMAANGYKYIYLAIRRPNKKPTIGTQIYSAVARAGTGAAATITGVGFTPDLVFCLLRNNGGGVTINTTIVDSLRGGGSSGAPRLFATNTNPESADSTSFTTFLQDGISIGGTDGTVNNPSYNYINYFFRRAPGFMDIVCWSYDGNFTRSHSLGVVPEMVIMKDRNLSDPGNWQTSFPLLSKGGGHLHNTDAILSGSPAATSTTFNISSQSTTGTYVAYLFATLPGISKVGSYIGNGGTAGSNGTSQTINCGFTTGARFILIKRADAVGDWYIWDTTRGIGTGNDPHLSLNTIAAEVSDDSIDPDNSGFIVNQISGTNINVTGATYVFLGIS